MLDRCSENDHGGKLDELFQRSETLWYPWKDKALFFFVFLYTVIENEGSWASRQLNKKLEAPFTLLLLWRFDTNIMRYACYWKKFLHLWHPQDTQHPMTVAIRMYIIDANNSLRYQFSNLSFVFQEKPFQKCLWSRAVAQCLSGCNHQRCSSTPTLLQHTCETYALQWVEGIELGC